MKYTKSTPIIGLGKLERERLSALLRATAVTISINDATGTLKISREKASKLLSAYAKKGWLLRIGGGIYTSVPLESETADIMPDDPLAIAEKLFSPCYVGGWSAAEHWGMTEQIYQSIIIMTKHMQKNYSPIIMNTEYLLHLTRPSLFFGLETVWKNKVKVLISNPTRTIVDLINHPLLGGGIRPSVDILKNYFLSKNKSIDLLIEYMIKLDNGAAYKRLGFVTEKFFPSEQCLINECQSRLTTGNAKLDASLKCDKLVTKWRLFVPGNWK